MGVHTAPCNLLAVPLRLMGEIKGPEKKKVIYKHALVIVHLLIAEYIIILFTVHTYSLDGLVPSLLPVFLHGEEPGYEHIISMVRGYSLH